ncbi:hypothetical protein HMPREF3213_03433 [Heyndrickxia coagulans]|uniref:Uncharacterized protein n=1 Tax=Heyndrickxia coagulans TaxID=1398 RepID=A0A133KCP0_HEYCO|nr:hypothetical protein HMPREF3213_03433 [Heyndrickxia coagulans]
MVSSIVTIPDVYRFFLIFPPIFAEWLCHSAFFWIALWRSAHQNAGYPILTEKWWGSRFEVLSCMDGEKSFIMKTGFCEHKISGRDFEWI